jgi:ribonuclease PH
MLVKFGSATCAGAAKANPVPAKHIRTNAAAIRLARFSMVPSSLDDQSQPGNANGARIGVPRRTRKAKPQPGTNASPQTTRLARHRG